LSRDRKIRPDEGLRRKEGSRQSEWGEPAIELENLFKEIAGFVASPSRPRQSSSWATAPSRRWSACSPQRLAARPTRCGAVPSGSNSG